MHRDKTWVITLMEGHTNDIGCVSVRADEMQVVFGLDDCSLHLSKMQDGGGRVWY